MSCANNLVLGGSQICLYGECKQICNADRADCNGSSVDGCETSINSDPKNCGGCGVTCDLASGQACVLGHCVVEPCETDAGVTR